MSPAHVTKIALYKKGGRGNSVTHLTSQNPLGFNGRRGFTHFLSVDSEVGVYRALGSLSLSFPIWRVGLSCLYWSCVLLWAVTEAAGS